MLIPSEISMLNLRDSGIGIFPGLFQPHQKTTPQTIPIQFTRLHFDQPGRKEIYIFAFYGSPPFSVSFL